MLSLFRADKCRVGRQPSHWQFQRPAFTSHLSFSGRHCQVEVKQPSQFQRPAFRVTSHLSSSFSGRHSPATSASEVGIHQPSQVGIAAVSVSEVRSGQVYSASPAIQGSDRASPATGRCLSFRATSQQQLPPLSSRRRSAARLRLRCPLAEARRHQPTIIDQSSMRA